MGHQHDHPAVQMQRTPHPEQHRHHPGSAAAFRWSVILNCGLSALQLVIGFGFGSLALIGDAVHNLGDVAGLLLGWGAERLSTRPPVGRFTYGFGRSTQLASLANGVLILMASAVVLVEAPLDLRVQRVMQRSGLTESEVRQRIARQWPDAQKRALTTPKDFILDNSGSEDALRAQVVAVDAELRRRGA